MKFVPAFVAVVLLLHLDRIKSNDEDSTDSSSLLEFLSTRLLPSPANSTTTSPERIKTTTAAPEQDPLDNISIQDLLLSGIDANEKIQKKIIDEIRSFPNNYLSYREPLTLTTTGYVFPKRQLTYDLDEGYITFNNIIVSHWYDRPFGESEKLQFSYSLSCDSSTNEKIRVGIPTNVRVSANFSIVHPRREWVNEGGVSIIIRNGTISKSDVSNSDDQISDNSELLFTNLKFDVEFSGVAKFQPPFNDKLNKFFAEVQSSLKEFFYQQVNKQMQERSLYLSSDCRKIRFAELYTKKINLPFYNNYLNNLYVIPETSIETWRGVLLSLGPIVLAGFSFNSTEFSVSREPYPDPYNGNSYKGRVSSRIKTGKLDGKFEWNYNSISESWNINSPLVFSFYIDNIIFENTYEYPSMPRPQMNVHLGDIKIKPTVNVTNFDTQEVKFAKFVISEYLKSTIARSLTRSLFDKVNDPRGPPPVENFFIHF